MLQRTNIVVGLLLHLVVLCLGVVITQTEGKIGSIGMSSNIYDGDISSEVSLPVFPKDMRFGVATAAYQIVGCKAIVIMNM